MTMTAEARSTTTTPVTAQGSAFTFYDIESLANAFTVCAYTETMRKGQVAGNLEVFYLVDSPESIVKSGKIDLPAITVAIREGNPAMPADTQVVFHDLATYAGTSALARLVGLSDAEQVCHADQPSSYPRELRPICDTDKGYDPRVHPFLAGYNSNNYDSVMLSLYLERAFAPHVRQQADIAELNRQLKHTNDPTERGDILQRLNDLMVAPGFAPVSAAAMRTENDRLFSAEHIGFMPGYLGWDSTAAKIRFSMLRSGRHIDVATLNESQKRVGLKRLLGMLGHQIKESEKLSHDTEITTMEQLAELLAYNVADCIGLARLFEHPTYSSAFDLKAGLLAEYPETVHDRDGVSVRGDRLRPDSTSAKFVGRILAPYKNLADIETVSFDYPHPAVAAERGIPVTNVLTDCVRFFESEVVPDRQTDPVQQAAHERFMEVMAYYRDIEGRNFNDSTAYRQRFGREADVLKEIPRRANNLPYFDHLGRPTSCFATFSTGGIHGAEAATDLHESLVEAYGDRVQMLVTARSLYPDARDLVAAAKAEHNTLHLPDGSSVDKPLVLIGSDPEKVRYRPEKKGEEVRNEQLARATAQVPNPADLLATQRDESQRWHVTTPDGDVIDAKIVLAKMTAKGATYKDAPAGRPPELFVTRSGASAGATKLHDGYARTSVGMVIHEDFSSYYPNLLRNMRAFYNPQLGEDRYAKIFFDKEELGAKLKNPGLDPAERERLSTLRAGTKLILNSASGAGDTVHKNPIQMNNRIISMRIIGQLFTWMIAQAQTLSGARIISTNTDGLYSVVDVEHADEDADEAEPTREVFTEEINNAVLARRSAAIGIDIEPEPLFLISKDSNNRLELGPPRGHEDLGRPEKVIVSKEGFDLSGLEIQAAGGGTLACHGGPTPTKSLAHPAVLDFALATYLRTVAAKGQAGLAEPFDRELGRMILTEALHGDDPLQAALLFQNVLAASRSSITYPFASEVPKPRDDEEGQDDEPVQKQAGTEGKDLIDPRPLQMINRVFVVTPGTPGAVNLRSAGSWKVTPDSKRKRAESKAVSVLRDPVAEKILRHHGWVADRQELTRSRGVTLLPEDEDVTIRKISGIDPMWPMRVVNEDLHCMSAQALRELLDRIDLEVYLQMLEATYTQNWMNAM